MGAHYDEKIIPLPDKSYRWFEKALLETTSLTPMRARAILRQCWRDIHNSCIAPDSKD